MPCSIFLWIKVHTTFKTNRGQLDSIWQIFNSFHPYNSHSMDFHFACFPRNNFFTMWGYARYLGIFPHSQIHMFGTSMPICSCIMVYVGSVALLSHNTLKWSAILGLSFFYSAGGPGNPCYRVQACLVNFALHFQKC